MRDKKTDIIPMKAGGIEHLERFSENVLEIWKKKPTIKKLFAPLLDEDEFDLFMGLGITMKANPFAREIWAVKYDKSKAATIFLGRDFIRKKAQEQQDYNGHQPVAVFSEDTFEYDLRHPSGLPNHVFDVTKNRGDLMGAYCFAYRKGVDRPFFVYVNLGEVNKKQSTWTTQTVTMVEKVAEARCLKMAWQGVFKGTYSEDEAPIIQHSVEIQEAKEKMKELSEAAKPAKDRITSKKIENQPETEWGDKLKRRMEKIYQTDGEVDYGVIAEELKRLSADKKGEGAVSDFADISGPRAKATLLRLEKEKFQKQLDIAIPDEVDQKDYLRAVSSFEDVGGLSDVEDFKSVEHIYSSKGKYKEDEKKGNYDDRIYDYREALRREFEGE